ncbi:MAG TPA: cupin domain-containing protein [Amycolatopsis sp.]|jgi:mannose-6-phosphate isomerase-like protein (cupin superfamily)|nr:cupin domain-containing protein [Amycolatopsis sp.]
MESDNKQSVFDVDAEIRLLPETADTMLADKYFLDKESASSRIFRIYREVPLHYHNECDENLYVVSGRGTFHLDGQEYEARPGMFLCFEKKKVHGFPAVTEHPLVVLAIDVPRRRPDDIVFVDPASGSAETFMARNARTAKE